MIKNQTLLIPELQRISTEEAERMFPECEADVPAVVALPTGIKAYNRNPAYIDIESNFIVLFQKYGRLAMKDPETMRDTIQHELVHWYQYRHLGYIRTSTLNTHRHKTWMDGCHIASTRLWPSEKIDRKEFNWRRTTGDHLTDVELHRWPYSMPDYLKKRSRTHDQKTNHQPKTEPSTF